MAHYSKTYTSPTQLTALLQSRGLHVETFPHFYLVLLRQPIAPMEPDGMSRVYQM